MIDEPYLKAPFYGSRRMAASLGRRGEVVNRQRVRRLMALMGPEGLHPRPRTTVADPAARAYPYLLRDRVRTRADEVWSSDKHQLEKGTGDPQEWESAQLFFDAWKKGEAKPACARMKVEWKELYG